MCEPLHAFKICTNLPACLHICVYVWLIQLMTSVLALFGKCKGLRLNMNEHRFLDGYIVEAETNGANRRIVVRTWWTFPVRTVIYANYLALCCSAASITTMSLYSKVPLRIGHVQSACVSHKQLAAHRYCMIAECENYHSGSFLARSPWLYVVCRCEQILHNRFWILIKSHLYRLVQKIHAIDDNCLSVTMCSCGCSCYNAVAYPVASL
jgi:hypothetical protein